MLLLIVESSHPCVRGTMVWQCGPRPFTDGVARIGADRELVAIWRRVCVYEANHVTVFLRFPLFCVCRDGGGETASELEY